MRIISLFKCVKLRKPISVFRFVLILIVQPNFHKFQSLFVIVEKLKVKFLPLKSARNCPPCKRPKKSKFAITKLVYSCRKSGQFVKDFSVTESVFFLFLLCRITTEAMGIWRFAGAFTVAQRQSECGSKTCRMHVSQPMTIGVCYAFVLFLLFGLLSIEQFIFRQFSA